MRGVVDSGQGRERDKEPQILRRGGGEGTGRCLFFQGNEEVGGEGGTWGTFHYWQGRPIGLDDRRRHAWQHLNRTRCYSAVSGDSVGSLNFDVEYGY